MVVDVEDEFGASRHRADGRRTYILLINVMICRNEVDGAKDYSGRGLLGLQRMMCKSMGFKLGKFFTPREL